MAQCSLNAMALGISFLFFLCIMYDCWFSPIRQKLIVKSSVPNKSLGTTLEKVEFVFSDDSHCDTTDSVKAVLKKHAELKIPQGAIFEVRNDTGDCSFMMLIISNPSDEKGFIVQHTYQFSPNTEPIDMVFKRSIAIYAERRDVKIRLHSGVRYQKICNGIPLLCNNKPVIDTIPEDSYIDAYLIR